MAIIANKNIGGFLIFMAGCVDMSDEVNKKGNIYKLKHSDLDVKVGKHSLLQNAKNVVNSSEKFTFSYSFRPNKSLIYRYSDKENSEHLKILKNVKKESLIQLEFLVDNGTGDGKNITLIAIQGNSSAKIKLKGQKSWFDALSLPIPPDTTISTFIEIKWDINGPEEIMLFPLKDEYVLENSHLIFRTVVLNDKEKITSEMIQKQEFPFNKTKTNEKITFFPSPRAVDKNGKFIQLKNQNDKLFALNEFNSIFLNEIPYQTNVDILWVSDRGNAKKIRTVNVVPFENTKIEFSKEELDFFKNYKGRQFLFFVNNREQEMLADFNAAINKKKPFLTSFAEVIEIFPYSKN
jgi:hypothetical protein